MFRRRRSSVTRCEVPWQRLWQRMAPGRMWAVGRVWRCRAGLRTRRTSHARLRGSPGLRPTHCATASRRLSSHVTTLGRKSHITRVPYGFVGALFTVAFGYRDQWPVCRRRWGAWGRAFRPAGAHELQVCSALRRTARGVVNRRQVGHGVVCVAGRRAEQT